jgi:acetolactate synthase small subunit
MQMLITSKDRNTFETEVNKQLNNGYKVLKVKTKILPYVDVYNHNKTHELYLAVLEKENKKQNNIKRYITTEDGRVIEVDECQI